MNGEAYSEVPHEVSCDSQRQWQIRCVGLYHGDDEGNGARGYRKARLVAQHRAYRGCFVGSRYSADGMQHDGCRYHRENQGDRDARTEPSEQ